MREGTVSIVAEFLSTFVTGLLSTDRLDMTASTPDSPDKGPGNEADASLIVVTLSGDCNDNPGLKVRQKAGAGIVVRDRSFLVRTVHLGRKKDIKVGVGTPIHCRFDSSSNW